MKLRKVDAKGTQNIRFILSMTASNGREACWYVETVKRFLDKDGPENMRYAIADDLHRGRQSLRDIINNRAGKA